MLKLVRLLLILVIPVSLCAQEITLENIWLNYAYSPRLGDQIDFQNTSSNYTRLIPDEMGNQKLELFDIKTGKVIETLFDGSKVENNLLVDNYAFSDDDKMVLLGTERERIYRYSTKSNYYTYNIDRNELNVLSNSGKQMYPQFSPDNKKVAFVRDNNLFYKIIKTDQEVQITKDGEFNSIINGHADWVYEEEFFLTRAYEWSKDGSKIMFAQFDESEVKEFSYPRYNGLYPEIVSFKFPKTGEANSKVILKLYDLKTHQLSTLDIPYKYEYIPRLYSTDNGFAFLLLNRHQNHLRLIDYNISTKKFSLTYEEKDDRYIDLPIAFEYLTGQNWIISSERDGYPHLYTIINKNVNAITSGDFEVTAFYGIDKEGWVYYQSTEESEVERQVHKINLNSKEKIALTTQSGTHTANFSGDNTFFIDQFSAAGLPYQITVKDTDGKVVRSIEKNPDLKKSIKPFWTGKDFFEIPLGSYSLNAWMMKPKDFDPSNQYPVLMFLYGGPGDQNVQNTWGGTDDIWFQMLTQKGYIVVSVDNRGTGMKGTEFKKMTYMKLGKYEVEDQVKSAKYLGGLPYIDGNRIGIFGWSYGGSLSALSLFEGKGTFKAALSVAPVTNWRYYDTVYTERYMRTPAENTEGYDKYSPIKAVSKWEEGALFLAHGMADDNVHFQNSVELVEAMNLAGKQYDFYMYPNRAHGIGGLANRYHLFTKMTNFILENL